MKQRISLFVVIIALCLSVFSGCSVNKPADNAVVPVVSDEFGKKIKGVDDFTSVIENEQYELLINGKTTAVGVRDKTTGFIWYSNPPDIDDLSLNEDDKAVLRSQIEISIFRGNNHTKYNSYSQCVVDDQFEFEKTENGIRVTYILGKVEKTYLIPTVIQREKLDALLEKLDEDDAYELLARYTAISLEDANDKNGYLTQYPSIKSHDLYVLETVYPEYVLQAMNDFFEAAGYTEQDLQHDNSVNSVNAPEKPVNVTIPLEYTLCKDGLEVNIPKGSIQRSTKDIHVTDITLLRFFGAGGAADEGYIFVPDGCGGLINFNNGKNQYDALKMPVYGYDYAIERKWIPGLLTECYLPIYGIKHQKDAFIAIIEAGDGITDLNAELSSKISPFNCAYPVFNITAYDTVDVSIDSKASMNKFQATPYDDDIRISYKLLNDKNATYSGMANAYRGYLTENKLLNKMKSEGDVPLFYTLIGTVGYDSNILGMPVEKQKRITGFGDAVQMSKELREKGVHAQSVKYFYWENAGRFDAVSAKAKPTGALGGAKGFRAMTEYMKEQNIPLYPDVHFATTWQNKWYDNFNKYDHASKFLSNDLAFRYGYNMVTGRRWWRDYMVSPKAYADFMEPFYKSYKKFDYPYLSLNSFGTELNSDFNPKQTINRQEAIDYTVEEFKTLTEQGVKLSSQGTNAYLFPYLTTVTGIPDQSSRQYLIDESVPFLQLVLHGFIEYAGEPLNYSDDFAASALKIIEYGMSPNFIWSFAPNSEFKNTWSNYYSVHYGTWMDKACLVYQDVNTALKAVRNQTMTSHNKLAENVFCTAYENGSKVYVNYNNTAVQFDSITIPGPGYFVKDGGNHNR